MSCALFSGLCSRAFVTASTGRSIHGFTHVQAEPKSAPAGSSVSLVTVTEESKITTASLIGGVAGLLVGGIWLGGALFAATSYLARKEDDDVSKALKGVASGGLEVVNFAASVNDKYMVTEKVGSAFSEAIGSAKNKNNPDSEGVAGIAGFLDTVVNSVKSLDKDIGIKDTLGDLAVSASDLAAQAVDKVVELNKEYKITDQISEKIQEASKSK